MRYVTISEVYLCKFLLLPAVTPNALTANFHDLEDETDRATQMGLLSIAFLVLLIKVQGPLFSAKNITASASSNGTKEGHVSMFLRFTLQFP